MSLIIPRDTIKAMQVLCDPVIRSNAGVKKNNLYVFPSLPQSVNHCSVRYGLDSVCQKLPILKHKMNPTKIRRRIGYLKAEMDMPETTIEFPPFNHSSGMIKSIYKVAQYHQQQELLRTANSLISIDDKGNFLKEVIFPYFHLFFLTWCVGRVYKPFALAFMRYSRDSGGEYLLVAHFYTQISIHN